MRSPRVVAGLVALVAASALLWIVPSAVRGGMIHVPGGISVNLSAADSDLRASTGVLTGALVLAVAAVVLAEIAKLSLIARSVSPLLSAAMVAVCQTGLFVDAIRISAPDWAATMWMVVGGSVPSNYSPFDPRWPWPSTILVVAAMSVIVRRSGTALSRSR